MASTTETAKTSEPTALVLGLRPERSRFQISTGRVVSKRVSRKEITNSSQEKVIERKKLAKMRRPHDRHGDQQQHLPFGGAEVARGALDVDLVVAHLAVDDGKAQRQIDHHMADAGGEQRFRQAEPVEERPAAPCR